MSVQFAFAGFNHVVEPGQIVAMASLPGSLAPPELRDEVKVAAALTKTSSWINELSPLYNPVGFNLGAFLAAAMQLFMCFLTGNLAGLPGAIAALIAAITGK